MRVSGGAARLAPHQNRSSRRAGRSPLTTVALLKRLDGRDITWLSKGNDVTIHVAVETETRRDDIKCIMGVDSVALTIGGKPCLEGTLPHRISTDDSVWQVEMNGEQKLVTLVLQKATRVDWTGLFEGDESAPISAPAAAAAKPPAAPAPPTPASAAVQMSLADLEAGASLLRRVQNTFSGEADKLGRELQKSMDAANDAVLADENAAGTDRVVRLPEGTLFTHSLYRSGYEVVEDPATGDRRCVASRDIEANEPLLVEHGLEAATRSALVLGISADGAMREQLWPREGRGAPPGFGGSTPDDIKESEAAAVSAALARLRFMELMAAKENNSFLVDPQLATRAGAQAALKDKVKRNALPRRIFLHLSAFNDCLPGGPNATFSFVPTPWGVFAVVFASQRIAAGEEVKIFYGEAHGRPWLAPEDLAAGLSAVQGVPPPPAPMQEQRKLFVAQQVREYLGSPTAAAAHRIAAQLVLNSRAKPVLDDAALAEAAKAAAGSGSGDASGMTNELKAVAGIGASAEEREALVRLCAEALMKSEGRWQGIARSPSASR